MNRLKLNNVNMNKFAHILSLEKTFQTFRDDRVEEVGEVRVNPESHPDVPIFKNPEKNLNILFKQNI